MHRQTRPVVEWMSRLLAGCCAIVIVGIAALALAEPQAGGEAPLEPIVVGTPQRIEVQPAAFKLESPQRRMHMIVAGYYADGTEQDLTRAAQLVSTNDAVVNARPPSIHAWHDSNDQ